MNIDIHTPEITLLLREVEQKSALTPRLVSDFGLLTDKINARGERLSQSTLERVWQYSTRCKDTVSEHTLDVLARYAGHSGWKAFRRYVQTNAHPESNYFTDGIFDVDSLQPGSMLSLTWLPDRMIKVSYLGDRRFEVVESQNSSIRSGDTFECTQIQVGEPLYLDRFRRGDATGDGKNARYVVGRDKGILSARIIDIEKDMKRHLPE